MAAHSAADGQTFQTWEAIEEAAAWNSTLPPRKTPVLANEDANDLSGRYNASAPRILVVPVNQETFFATDQVIARVLGFRV